MTIETAPDANPTVPTTTEPTTAPAATAVPPPTAPPQNVVLTSRTEFPSVQAAQSAPQDIIALAHLEAPEVDLEHQRAKPLKLSAVIDVSGSMRGEKLRLAKESLVFMVNELSERDEFGIVAFESSVFTVLPVTRMDGEGKELAFAAIAKLREMGCTNLSGGLFLGIDQLLGKPTTTTARDPLDDLFAPQQMQRNSNNRANRRAHFNPAVATLAPATPAMPSPLKVKVATQHTTVKRGGKSMHCYWLQLEAEPTYALAEAVTTTPNGKTYKGADITVDPTDEPIGAFSIALPDNKHTTILHIVKPDNEDFTESYSVRDGVVTAFDPNAVVKVPPPAPVSAPEEKKAANAFSRSVMIFTDGQANNGITDTNALVAETQRRLADPEAMDITVYTFGFGADHNVNMLRGIADASQGSYYFVEGTSAMKEAFADCLAGLVSIVAQDLVLTVTCKDPAVTVARVMTQFPVTGTGATRTIKLKDIYGGEKRDILVKLTVGSDAAVRESLPLVAFSLKYDNCLTKSNVVEEADAAVAVVAEKYDGKPEMEIDEHRNRIEIAEAMAEARRLADARDREGAREHMKKMKAKVAVSASAATDTMFMMQEQMDDCMDCMESESLWSAKGTKAVSNMAQMHMQQRCADVSGAGNMYATSAKRNMRAKAKK